MRNILSIALVLLLGTALLWGGTSGFQAFTAEGARRLDVANHPRTLPDVQLQDANGHFFHLSDYNGKLVLLTFMYTACTDACPILESNFQKVYQGISASHLGKDVVFISVSFDHERDTPEMLQSYGKHMGVDGVNWRLARVVNVSDQAALLKRFNVVVIPDNDGGFEHNTAIYLINRQGLLSEIMDDNAPKAIITKIMSMMKG